MSRSRKYAPLLFALVACRCYAGGFEKVWELRFSDLAESKIRDSAAPVFAISFSPDGRHLAAVVLGDQDRRQRVSFLLIVDLANPESVPRFSESMDQRLTMIFYRRCLGRQQAISLLCRWSFKSAAVAAVFYRIRSGSSTMTLTELRTASLNFRRRVSIFLMRDVRPRALGSLMESGRYRTRHRNDTCLRCPAISPNRHKSSLRTRTERISSTIGV